MTNKVSKLPPDYWVNLAEYPYDHSFYQVLRYLDAKHQLRKPIGRNTSPSHEPFRMRQEPSMIFAPSNLTRVDIHDNGRPPTISILGFGLWGPNGPLPLHLTEYAKERIYHHRDKTLSAFTDIFHHRLITLFYRAWADAQNTVGLDLPNSPFKKYIGSFIGLGIPKALNNDSISDSAKLYFSSHLLRQTRNPEGLTQMLRKYFEVPVNILEFIPQWIFIEKNERSTLNGTVQLGVNCIIGTQVRDVQHKFRIQIGPVNRAKFESFFPGTKNAKQLIEWVRLYVGYEFAWDVQLILLDEFRGQTRLGRNALLGLSSFSGKNTKKTNDFDELFIDYEARDRNKRHQDALISTMFVSDSDESEAPQATL
ncbi:type VI secretion system baseplate subunit TssG [Taylorella equigenitalis]|nr:type VI secretion system baseplate subunit TssG [Taylorella equigenitalis]WEE00508.1 type VI secretion system baseplate subunit TssG [Taylorella equigenitalis]WEE01985.1 type VI secretion system baseplate subunit TssG [Taylorella equigenitalis]WFD79999.1 type VI secretion system baseplate subunit TssG [Taylorella equigenitalis]WFD81476.1 type VI secretion system baseplate subunit TssG [Taylorella equigenitalis]WFD82955.1 type VI secretion system baseplate subunit TssG [Taylorella equigenita